MITQEINLNMIPDSEPVVMRVNQYDEGEGRLVIHLYKDNVAYSPSIATVIIQGTKPDKKGFAYDATISGNTVTADLTRQMTACAGDVRTQIIVTESEGKTGTFVFILKVQESALQLGTDMSETEIPAYLDGGVISVNGKTGSVVLSYRDVGALSDSTVIPDMLSDLQQDSTHRTVTDSEKATWNNKADISNIPTTLSDLSQDSTHRVVSDAEKATWNGKLSNVPTASANTLGGVKVGNGLVIDNNGVLSATGGSGSGAVDSVNGKTGNVVLELADLAGDSTHRTVTDAEKAAWNAASPTNLSDLSDFNVDTALNQGVFQLLYYDSINGLMSRNRIDIDADVNSLSVPMGTWRDSYYVYDVYKHRITIPASSFDSTSIYAEVCDILNSEVIGATIYDPESYIKITRTSGGSYFSPCHYYYMDTTYDKANFYYTFHQQSNKLNVQVFTDLESIPSIQTNFLDEIVLTVVVWTRTSL